MAKKTARGGHKSSPEELRRATAFHEAGHAVMAMRFPAVRFSSVTIIAESNCLGYCKTRVPKWITRREPARRPERQWLLQCHAMVHLAGPSAHERYEGSLSPTGVSAYVNDYEKAMVMALLLCDEEDEAEKWLEWLTLRTEKWAASHWREIEAVAGALLVKPTLRRDEVIRAVCGAFPLED